MNEEFWISILMFGSTVFAFLVSLSEQRQNHQRILFSRMLKWERLEENFARIFLMGLGAIVGGYLAEGLGSLLGTESTKFAFGMLGGLIGAGVARYVIFEKMVAPQFREMDSEKIISSLQPPQEP